jgi:hypothetical protein
MVMIYKMENEHEIWHLESQEFLYIRFIESVARKLAKYLCTLDLLESKRSDW